jgi:hypothetical protein
MRNVVKADPAVALRRAWRLLSFLIATLCATVAATSPDVTVKAQTATQQFAPSDEKPEDFPAGAGREETFYACVACHNFKLIAQQGMNRRQWEESLDWMTEKHNMPELSAADRKIVLDYLETTYPPRAPAAQGGWQNPFMRR